ncbi:GNAT family N-acetyltransferase [Salipaludibacillus sp. HK11]|uniref:GNAT family N-acetyltransferase n=1 Tax=Salipaludibacillus sp. HK11 TaxID=3394320 RepID=UPI0039FD6D86
MLQWNWMTNEAALEIVEWEYDDEYSFYDIQNEVDDLDEFLNPFKWNHYAAIYEDDELVGYFRFNPLNLHDVEIALGLRPDLTGLGKGYAFTKYAIETALKWYEPKKLLVNVAEFNQRAIHVFQKHKFDKVSYFQRNTNGRDYRFVKLERDFL